MYNTIVDKIKNMDNEIVKKFAKNMKKIREAKKMSQGDIYRAAKIERTYISSLESGKQNPTLETVAKIAKALGVPTDKLLK